MSWSIHVLGKPADIVAELQAESSRLTGDSKTEFDAALPNLTALVQQNIALPPSNPPVLRLQASGHASFTAGQISYSQCVVTLESMGARMARPAASPPSTAAAGTGTP